MKIAGIRQGQVEEAAGSPTLANIFPGSNCAHPSQHGGSASVLHLDFPVEGVITFGFLHRNSKSQDATLRRRTLPGCPIGPGYNRSLSSCPSQPPNRDINTRRITKRILEGTSAGYGEDSVSAVRQESYLQSLLGCPLEPLEELLKETYASPPASYPINSTQNSAG